MKIEDIGNKLIGQIEILEKNGNITKGASKSIIDNLQNFYSSFENRTCSNCKHYKVVNGWIDCEKEVFELGDNAKIDEKSMSCNKWSQK